MADDDDDGFFGDFKFASKSPKADDSFDDDDDWGDFVATRSDSINGLGPPSWVRPEGALPLSLFGESEEDKSGASESALGFAEPILFVDEKKKIKNGSSLNVGVGIGDLIADLYGRSEKISVRNESVATSNGDSSNWNQNGHHVGFQNADSSSSKFDSGVSGLNLNSNGLSSVSQQQREDFDDDDDGDDDAGGWEFHGADGNEQEQKTVEVQGLKVEINQAKDSEIQVDGGRRVKVEEFMPSFNSSNGLHDLFDTSIQSNDTVNDVCGRSVALDFNATSLNQNDFLWDSHSKSNEKSDTKIGSNFSSVAENGGFNNLWQFEDAFSGAGAEPQYEAAKVFAVTDLGIPTENGDDPLAPTNFFVQSEGTFHRPEQWGRGFAFKSSSARQDSATTHVTYESKENNTGESLKSSQDNELDEFEENVWEFKDAYIDSGSQKEEDSKISPDPPANMSPPEHDGANQGNEMKSGSHREALPLSLFGDEELETNVSSDRDVATHTFTSYTRNTNHSSSNLSINDLISSLYGQAEQSTSVHDLPNTTENEPHSIMRPKESDLVYPNDDFDDVSWEFKDASLGAKTPNQTFVTHLVDSPTESSTKLQLENFINFYCKLKDESCYVVLNHFETLKKAQSSSIEALGEETQRFYDQLCQDNKMREFDLEDMPQRSSGINELRQVLHEPKFSVLDSKYHLSNMLSLAEKDLESAVKLSKHAASTLQILELGSAEEQSIYVSTWSKIISICVQELKHGASIWIQALQKGVAGQILAESQGKLYITALGEIYRVVQVLGASVKLYKPWVLLSSEGPGCLYALLNECTSLWSTSGLDEALQSISEAIDFEFDGTLTELLGSIKHIQTHDAFALHDLVFSGKEPLCRLSMLTPGIVPGIKLVSWDGDQYLLKLANLWANLISSNRPDLPMLNIS